MKQREKERLRQEQLRIEAEKHIEQQHQTMERQRFMESLFHQQHDDIQIGEAYPVEIKKKSLKSKKARKVKDAALDISDLDDLENIASMNSVTPETQVQ